MAHFSLQKPWCEYLPLSLYHLSCPTLSTHHVGHHHLKPIRSHKRYFTHTHNTQYTHMDNMNTSATINMTNLSRSLFALSRKTCKTRLLPC